jgi:hypothetical protein
VVKDALNQFIILKQREKAKFKRLSSEMVELILVILNVIKKKLKNNLNSFVLFLVQLMTLSVLQLTERGDWDPYYISLVLFCSFSFIITDSQKLIKFVIIVVSPCFVVSIILKEAKSIVQLLNQEEPKEQDYFIFEHNEAKNNLKDEF